MTTAGRIKPRPIKVGDNVKPRGASRSSTVKAIIDEKAWLCAGDYDFVSPVSQLVKV